jgi:hypothetical protein
MVSHELAYRRLDMDSGTHGGWRADLLLIGARGRPFDLVRIAPE